MKDELVYFEHIHDYLGLDLKLIWSVVDKRLPHLRREVERMLEDTKP